MYNITFILPLNKWAVINENGDVLVYADNKEDAIATMEHMNGS